MAIVYKKKIAALEAELLSEPEFSQRLWLNKPVLTHEELLLKLVDIDAAFAKNLLAKSLSKTKTASMFLIVQSQKQVSSQKMKQNCDEVILALYTRLSEIQTAIDALTPELASLSHSEVELLVSEGKMKNFVAGIRVLHAIATLQLKNIEVAVDREDDQHSIDFEAIKRELAQIRRQFETSYVSLTQLFNSRSPSAFES